MNRLILVITIITFISCNKENRQKYYENGILKEIRVFGKDKKLDSSIIYYSSPYNENIKEVRVWDEKLSLSKNFDKDGRIMAEGYFIGLNPMKRIGNWTFYSKDHDSIVEYVQVEGKSYTNQNWLINAKGDTLETRGNYFYFSIKDTISVDEEVRLSFYLSNPSNSYKSNLEVVLPSRDNDLFKDFSNFLDIERDTFPSLKNDQIPHPEIPNDVPLNHLVVFGLIYSEPGVKRIRGALIEYSDRNSNDITLPDSINRLERRLYFDKSIYVKDIKE